MKKWDTLNFVTVFQNICPESFSTQPLSLSVSGFPLNPKHELHSQIFFLRKCTCVCISTRYCCANIWSWFIKLSRDVFHCSLHLMAFTFVSCTDSVSIAFSAKPFCCFCLPYLCAVWFPVERKEEGVVAFRK